MALQLTDEQGNTFEVRSAEDAVKSIAIDELERVIAKAIGDATRSVLACSISAVECKGFLHGVSLQLSLKDAPTSEPF